MTSNNVIGNGYSPLGLFDPTEFTDSDVKTPNNSDASDKNQQEANDTPKIKMPDAIQVIDEPDADYYVAVGLYDNFNGMSKANFISSADVQTESDDELADYKMQDLFYGAHHFNDLPSAVEIIKQYYQYYGTESQRYAVYGVNNDTVKLVWYHDGFYSYIGKSQSEHGDNWFYGIVDFNVLKEDFEQQNAPILFKGQTLNESIVPTIGGFPRDLVIAQYGRVHNGERTIYLYYYQDPHAFDTAMSRLARLESQTLKNAYNIENIKKSIMKQNSLLERATDSIELTDYAKNEKQVPAWVRSLARYGRND